MTLDRDIYNNCYFCDDVVMTADLLPLPISYLRGDELLNRFNAPINLRKAPCEIVSSNFKTSIVTQEVEVGF